MSAGEAVQAAPARRSLVRPMVFGLVAVSALALLFGVPWWTLVRAGTHWPVGVTVAGTVLFAAALVALPIMMVLGNGRNARDWASRTGTTILGVIWIFFAWGVLGKVLRLALVAGGVADPLRARIV
jgi:hypothetical protein